MRLDLYQAETARIAAEQAALLRQARQILEQGRTLTALEQSGVLHALQVLIENAIGKAKQLLKMHNEPVPVSAMTPLPRCRVAALARWRVGALARCSEIEQDALSAWNAVIGLRNRIVHDYMNVDMSKVMELVLSEKDKFITEFLLKVVAEK